MKKNILFFVLCWLCQLNLHGQSYLYVDSLNGNDANAGSTWNSSLQTLGQALKMAHEDLSIEKVFVAKGTYYPSFKPFEMGSNQLGTELSALGNSSKTFHIRVGLEVYGGYPNGGGTKNPFDNPTILDGVLNALDTVFHVVMMDSSSHWSYTNDTTVLDGFFICHSRLDSGSVIVNSTVVPNTTGGAIVVNRGLNIIRSNYIHASQNSGIKVNNSFCVIQNCVLTNLSMIPIQLKKGILFFVNNSICFNANTTGNSGLVNDSAEVHLFNNFFYRNKNLLNANSQMDYSSNVQLETRFNYFWEHLKLGNNVFVPANSEPMFKGGNGPDSLALVGCSIGIDAGSAALQNIPSFDIMGNPRIHDVTFIPDMGVGGIDLGAFENQEISLVAPVTPTILSVVSNPTFKLGGGKFVNEVLGASHSANWYSASVGGDLLSSNEINWETNMLFQSKTYYVSAAFGACESSTRLAVLDSILACNVAQTIYVDSAIAVSGNGSSWSQAFKTFGEAAAISQSCLNVDTILVAKGTYFPEHYLFVYYGDSSGTNVYPISDEVQLTDNRDKTIQLRSGIKVFGGHSNGGGVRDINQFPTRFSGAMPSGDTSYHVVSVVSALPDTVVIDGVTIENGNANQNSATLGEYFPGNFLSNRNLGGGVYIHGNLKMNQVKIKNCSAIKGGGIGLRSGFIMVDNSILKNNKAKKGGALYEEGSSMVVIHSTVEGNLADSGGAFYSRSGGVVYGSTILGNQAIDGAAVFSEVNIKMYDNVIAKNEASHTGILYGGFGAIHFNTFFANRADSHATCLYSRVNSWFSQSLIDGNIFYQNKLQNSTNIPGVDIAFKDATSTYWTTKSNSMQLPLTSYVNTTQLNYSLGVITWNNNENKFLLNPNFADTSSIAGPDGKHRTADDGLRLLTPSPLIDSASYIGGLIYYSDIKGNDREQSTRIDFGAYENGNCSPPNYIFTPVYDTVCYNQTVQIWFISYGAGVWNITLMSSQGCDSLIELHLAEYPQFELRDTVVACDSFYWAAKNQTYYLTTNTYLDTINSNGCPYRHYLNLVIGHSNVVPVQTVTATNSYTWPKNNQTYTVSGVYTHSGVNADGCTELFTLNLTIIDSLVGIHGVPWEQEGIILFPNPTQQQLHLNIEQAQQGEYTILFFDLSGRKVKQLQLKNSELKLLTSLSVGDLTNGVYKVSIYENEQLRAIRKIEIMR